MKDSKNREVMLGDVLKVFHFIGARRKRYYMYKVAALKNMELKAFDITEVAQLGFHEAHYCRLESLDDFEIVQGWDKSGKNFEDRESK